MRRMSNSRPPPIYMLVSLTPDRPAAGADGASEDETDDPGDNAPVEEEHDAEDGEDDGGDKRECNHAVHVSRRTLLLCACSGGSRAGAITPS